MTNEEAVELLHEMQERCNLPTSTDPKRFKKSDALEIAMEAIEQSKKYPDELIKRFDRVAEIYAKAKDAGYIYDPVGYALYKAWVEERQEDGGQMVGK